MDSGRGGEHGKLRRGGEHAKDQGSMYGIQKWWQQIDEENTQRIEVAKDLKLPVRSNASIQNVQSKHVTFHKP